MAVLLHELKQWFEKGKSQGHIYMIVACDQGSWKHYPIYAKDDATCLKKCKGLDTSQNQMISEVYDLRLTWDEQAGGGRVDNRPEPPAPNDYECQFRREQRVNFIVQANSLQEAEEKAQAFVEGLDLDSPDDESDDPGEMEVVIVNAAQPLVLGPVCVTEVSPGGKPK